MAKVKIPLSIRSYVELMITYPTKSAGPKANGHEQQSRSRSKNQEATLNLKDLVNDAM